MLHPIKVITFTVEKSMRFFLIIRSNYATTELPDYGMDR